MNSVMAGKSSWIRDGSQFTPWLNRSSVPDISHSKIVKIKKCVGTYCEIARLIAVCGGSGNVITIQQKPSIMTSFVTLVLSILIQLSHSGEKSLEAFA